MIVKRKTAVPVKQPDGTWKVILEESEEEVPDLGRPLLICNKCGWSTYPECMEWCGIPRQGKRNEG